MWNEDEVNGSGDCSDCEDKHDEEPSATMNVETCSKRLEKGKYAEEGACEQRWKGKGFAADVRATCVREWWRKGFGRRRRWVAWSHDAQRLVERHSTALRPSVKREVVDRRRMSART